MIHYLLLLTVRRQKRCLAATKKQQEEDYKGEYAQQLVKTNQSQSEYFNYSFKIHKKKLVSLKQ